jgi:glycine cleavage system H protein
MGNTQPGKIFMKFTQSHEWICTDEGIGTVGITDHAQKELGNIVYLELPPIGKRVKAGEEIAVLESTKAAADIYAPVSGEVVAINESLALSAHLVNQAAESEGWLFKVKLDAVEELEELLTRDQYLAMVSP